MGSPKELFTKTVENYNKYRPHYPKEVLNVLVQECGLTSQITVADVGSGTGILTRLLLDNGNLVYGVEPNQAMRLVAEKNLDIYPRFVSVNGSAEDTTLTNNSIDLITAGTAFHWFEPEKTKKEFKRILTKNGWVLMVWNVRNMASIIVRDYEDLLLEFCPTYPASKAQEFEKTAVCEFFAPFEMFTKIFPNQQFFDWEGFKGRLLSTSYCLTPENEHYIAMLAKLKIIFDKHQVRGIVNFSYETKLYYGHM